MRNDFVAFILSHGRPDRVLTYDTLKRAGYTGRVVIVIDDEDETGDQYRERFGDEVVVFSKPEVERECDIGDNFVKSQGTVFHARNACWQIARDLGVRYFIQLDDDYSGLYYRQDPQGRYVVQRVDTTLDALLEAMVEFVERTPFITLCMSQGGDHIGRAGGQMGLRRKAMNTFVCSVDRPFLFVGRINEDVNTYVSRGRRGELLGTMMQAQVNQMMTQQNDGGMADIYRSLGTYRKTFYTVLYAPSCCKVATLADPRSPHPRIHHRISGRHAYVKILRESHRKASKPIGT